MICKIHFVFFFNVRWGCRYLIYIFIIYFSKFNNSASGVVVSQYPPRYWPGFCAFYCYILIPTLGSFMFYIFSTYYLFFDGHCSPVGPICMCRIRQPMFASMSLSHVHLPANPTVYPMFFYILFLFNIVFFCPRRWSASAPLARALFTCLPTCLSSRSVSTSTKFILVDPASWHGQVDLVQLVQSTQQPSFIPFSSVIYFERC